MRVIVSIFGKSGDLFIEQSPKGTSLCNKQNFIHKTKILETRGKYHVCRERPKIVDDQPLEGNKNTVH